MKVLNFGSLNVDYVYQVDHMVMPGETQSSFGMEIFLGGKGFNQSVALAKAGVPVYHAGLIGDDGLAFLDAAKVADQGKGVACLYGNYSGDNMNVKMAVKMAKKAGITVGNYDLTDEVKRQR